MSDQNNNEIIPISRNKFQMIQKILRNMHDSLGNLVELLQNTEGLTGDVDLTALQQQLSTMSNEVEILGGDRVIEGVFDGEKMISSDGQEYSVPPNYASKSKLVEGDILKLTITRGGNFVYKQIGPVERKRVSGDLLEDATGSWYVVSGKKKWRVLPASISYYKGDANDEVILLVPKDATSAWGAVENIIKK